MAEEQYTDLLSTSSSPASPPRFINDDKSDYKAPNTNDPGASFPARRRSSSLIPPANANGVIFNLMNAVIGVGVLAMPYTFKRAGLILAPILLLIVGGLTERSLCLMVRAGDMLRQGDSEDTSPQTLAIGYSATVARCFGPNYGTMSDVFIVIMNFGSAVAYLDVIADILAAWVGQESKTIGLVLVVLFIVGPLSCVRAIEKLKFTSLLGLAIYALFGLITIALFFVGVSCGGEAHVPLASSDLLVAVPIQTLAFACHTVVFPVYREFRESPGSDSATFQKALQKTIVLCMTMYVLVGFFGALTFRDNTLGDILKNYSGEGGGFAHFIEAIFAFSICMTYPLLVFPMRDSLDILLMKMNCIKELPRSRGWSSSEFEKVKSFKKF
jgi:solute carrier family 38 (sodium-coupled neutral amino acid transporter), member 2